MVVCCVVFDIDGMLFEFVMNFVNIENIFNNISCFLRVFSSASRKAAELF